MKKQNYITIQGWMVSDLHLKGNALLVYAIIYGFSQDGTGEFCGSLNYLSEWMNVTKQTVMNTLGDLVERGLLKKNKQTINGVQIVRYAAVVPEQEVKPIPKPENTVDWKSVIDDYNQTCTNLPACKKINDSRKQAIKARLKDYSPDELHQIFVKAQASAFLTGKKPGCDFRASFDWLMNPTNAAKVFDGNYDDRQKGGEANESLENAGLYDSFTI